MKKKTGSICSSNCLNHWSQYGGHPIYKVCVEDCIRKVLLILTEIFHQSNKALNELVNKNLTYLHMWSAYLQKASTEKEICDYINKEYRKKQDFRALLFLSFDGNYKTITGRNRVSWITGNLDDKITQRNDIIMNASAAWKITDACFACPEVNGIYQGFEYDAIAVAYDISDIVKVLDISAFQGNANWICSSFRRTRCD